VASPNYITPEGYERLRRELYDLIHEQRPAAVDAVAIAAAHGDRSENAEYIYGKKKLRAIDRRIAFLSGRMDKAEVVGSPDTPDDRVRFGAIVTVEEEDEDGESTHRYRLVGADETDAAEGLVSWKAPVGRALLGRRVGDMAEVRTPGGERDLYIVAIDYP